jgi:hypothetical protein
MRLSKPVYESLPYVYMGFGAGALAFSYYWHAPGWSDLIVGLGFLAVICGLVLVLKRRDYRIQRRRYGSAFEDED